MKNKPCEQSDVEEGKQADAVHDAGDVNSAMVALEREGEEERQMSVDREEDVDDEAVRGGDNKEKEVISGEDGVREEEVRGEDGEGKEEDKETGENANCVGCKTVSKQNLKQSLHFTISAVP